MFAANGKKKKIPTCFIIEINEHILVSSYILFDNLVGAGNFV